VTPAREKKHPGYKVSHNRGDRTTPTIASPEEVGGKKGKAQAPANPWGGKRGGGEKSIGRDWVVVGDA